MTTGSRVQTRLTDVKGASFVMPQEVWRDDTLLFRAAVTVVVLTAEGRATRLPADIRAKARALHGRCQHLTEKCSQTLLYIW